MKKNVGLVSGGMGSVSALYDAHAEYRAVGALSFDYGSKHNHKEIPFAVDAYNVYRDGDKIATTGFIDYTNVIEGPVSASYRYGVCAVDVAGNEAKSDEITVRATR